MKGNFFTMDKYAIVVAAGSGNRMGTNLPKQFLLVRNKPMLWYTLTAFLDAFEDIFIILVLPEHYLEKGMEIIQSTPEPHRISVIKGGKTRFHSVLNGLEKIPFSSIVLINVGIRCLLMLHLIK